MFKSSVLAYVAATKCPFGYSSSQKTPTSLAMTKLKQDDIIWPSQLLTCPEDKQIVRLTQNLTHQDYMDIVDAIIDLYNSFAGNEDLPQRNFAGCLLRFAGHDFLDFRVHEDGTTTGGSDGCIKLDEPDNAGLAGCTQATGIQDIYSEWCDVISLADFLVIAAEAVMGRTEEGADERDRWAEEGLNFRFMDQFRFGRETKDTCDGVGLMPDAEQGCDAVKEIMVDHMFGGGNWGWNAAAAIMGVHSLGSAKLENSGYEGHWSDIENQGIFNNNYYRSIIMKGWGPQYSVGGRDDRNQWKRIDAMAGQNDEMMLTTDLCLFYDNNLDFQACIAEGTNFGQCRSQFQNGGEFLDPLVTECCAWTFSSKLYSRDILLEDVEYDYCGVSIINHNQGQEKKNSFQLSTMQDTCCGAASETNIGDCTTSNWPKGAAEGRVARFAADEPFWHEKFLHAWRVATENGLASTRKNLQD